MIFGRLAAWGRNAWFGRWIPEERRRVSIAHVGAFAPSTAAAGSFDPREASADHDASRRVLLVEASQAQAQTTFNASKRAFVDHFPEVAE